MKNVIIDFLHAKEEDMVVEGDTFSFEEAVAVLVDLGFEYGEEQDADGVRYSQFHHESFDSLTIKQRLNRSKLEIIKE